MHFAGLATILQPAEMERKLAVSAIAAKSIPAASVTATGLGAVG
jgi:hypothetical protein